MKKKTLDTLLLTALLSVAAGAQTTANKGPDRAVAEDGHWVGTWATAPHQPDLGVPGLANQGFENQTVRQIVHTSVEGRQVRVRLSAFGSNGLVIGAAHVALRAAAATILPESDRVLTFGGSPTITIPAGALVLSDPVNLNVPALSDLAISIYTSGAIRPRNLALRIPAAFLCIDAGRFHGKRQHARSVKHASLVLARRCRSRYAHRGGRRVW